MEIDKIFIINLNYRTDRKEHIINEMKKHNISNYEFYTAIKPTLEDVYKWHINYCAPHNDIYKIGAFGCLTSHIEIFKISLERKYKNILILEDDIVFKKDYDYNKIFEYSSQINNNYDILYLSGSHIEPITYITQNIKKCTHTYTTHSYLIKENIMKYILDNITNCITEIDVFYVQILQPIFNCYVTYPHLTAQIPSFSDIQNKNVNYNL